MIIKFKPDIYAKIMTIAAYCPNHEFSGFGFVERVDGDILVYDFVLLNVGSAGYTQTNPETILPLLDRPDAKNMKLWLHKHPVGPGIPGPANWSMTDHETCVNTPMGGLPELIDWSCAVVMTPRGMVGRVDFHRKKKTVHCEVEQDRGLIKEVQDLTKKYFQKQIQEDIKQAQEEDDEYYTDKLIEFFDRKVFELNRGLQLFPEVD